MAWGYGALLEDERYNLTLPRMIVGAGPSGSGKSTLFPMFDLCSTAFNVDDRAAALHGGYVGVTPVLRRQAQLECEFFIANQIATGVSFAVETTLRSDAALRQVVSARSAGFATMLINVCAGNVEDNIMRVARRGALGGHSAPESEIRDIYTKSPPECCSMPPTYFDTSEPWHAPRKVVELRNDHVRIVAPTPAWVPDVWKA